MYIKKWNKSSDGLAHTPDAYEKVLGTLKELINKDNKIYAVFGAGGDRDKNKKILKWQELLKYSATNALLDSR